MKNKLTIMLALLLPLPFMVACGDDDGIDELLDPGTESDNVEQCKRTVLVYMVASNSLGSNGYDSDDIAEMKQAMSEYTTGECRLLLYHAVYNSAPTLTEIKNDGAGSYQTDTLVTYPSTSQASVTRDRVSQVIADAMEYAPAEDYGLILWSHATGWARSLTKSVATIRDFGEDSGATMPIDSLADAIPDNAFSFIYADACYMGSIEVAYQLRNKTDYFVGSPTEIPAYGMPYDQNIPCFFEDEPNLTQACENTYTFYRDLESIDGLSEEYVALYRSVTISLVDCSMLEEIASVCRQIHATAQAVTSLSSIQHYHLTKPHFLYDFKQYTDLISSDDTLTATFDSLLEQMVIYKACTTSLFGLLTIDEDNYSGLSTYIMGTGSDTNEEYYTTLDWYNDVIAQ